MTTTKEQLLDKMTWLGRQARATRRMTEFRQQVVCLRDGDLIVAGFEFPGSGETDEAQEVWRMFMAILIQSAAADAVVFCSDTWIVRDDAAKDSQEKGIQPRNHPDRQDAIAILGVRSDGYTAQETWTYKIRGDKGDFHGTERMFFDQEDGTSVGGRMIDALRLGLSMPEPRDPERVDRLRDMLVLGHQAGVEIVIHEEVWAAKYGAGLQVIKVPPMDDETREAWDESNRDDREGDGADPE